MEKTSPTFSIVSQIKPERRNPYSACEIYQLLLPSSSNYGSRVHARIEGFPPYGHRKRTWKKLRIQCTIRGGGGLLSLEQGCPARCDFAPKGTLGNVWRHFWLSQLRGGGEKDEDEKPLASSGQRPGWLINIQQCSGQLPQQSINSAEVEAP